MYPDSLSQVNLSGQKCTVETDAFGTYSYKARIHQETRKAHIWQTVIVLCKKPEIPHGLICMVWMGMALCFVASMIDEVRYRYQIVHPSCVGADGGCCRRLRVGKEMDALYDKPPSNFIIDIQARSISCV